MKRIESIKAVYNACKRDFDSSPLEERNLNTGEDWFIFHQIKIELIERMDIDIWKVKNQFEFAIMMDAYRIDYLPYIGRYEFPLTIQFNEVGTGVGTVSFNHEIIHL